MSKRGSGKSKHMIAHANQSAKDSNGHIVFIDDDNRPMHELGRDIRFINTESFQINDLNTLYGLLCGILAQDYDVESIYVDGLMSGMDFTVEGAEGQFNKLTALSDDNKITIFFALNDNDEVPEFLRKYKVEIE